MEALTGRRPRVYRMKDGRIRIKCGNRRVSPRRKERDLDKAPQEVLALLVESS
jgi:hypothetical protein